MNELKLQQFYDHLQKKPECLSKAKEIGSDMTALSRYALELGYEVTAEELTAFSSKAKRVLEAKMKELETSKAALSDGAKQFMEFSRLADADPEVAKRITELFKSPQEMITYGKEKGFSFDTNDMEEVAKKLMEQEEELSDDELEAAAGGVTLLAVGVGAVLVFSAVVGVGSVAAAVAIGVALIVAGE